MYETVKNITRLTHKEKLSKQKKDVPQMNKKTVRNHSKIFRKYFFHKRNTNAERITNTDVNTIQIIRNKKRSMDSKK